MLAIGCSDNNITNTDKTPLFTCVVVVTNLESQEILYEYPYDTFTPFNSFMVNIPQGQYNINIQYGWIYPNNLNLFWSLEGEGIYNVIECDNSLQYQYNSNHTLNEDVLSFGFIQ